MSCGIKILKAKLGDFHLVEIDVKKEAKAIEEIIEIAYEVMKDEFYEKKMSLGRMLQIMSEKGEDIE